LLIIRALSSEYFCIHHLSDSDDTQVLSAGLNCPSDIIDIGHAGTSMRFLTAYFAATGQVKTVTGSERMKNRPVKNLVEALNQLNAQICYLEKEGYPPVRTSGNILSGNYLEINGNVSSQFISALLMIAPALPEGLNIRITGEQVSSSYIRMTLELMKQMGIYSETSDNTISIPPQKYRATEITVERDWSAASYWYQIAALSGEPELMLDGLYQESLQGDSVTARLFEPLGIRTDFSDAGAFITKTDSNCSFFEFDFINAPDLVQTIAVTLCLRNIPFRFTGVRTLSIKETDRLQALQNELLKLGYCIELPEPDVMEWRNKRTEPQKNICISTCNDHRMAMAFAPAVLSFPGLQIENPHVVCKSYPNFWNDLKNAGFVIE
jgi:3-phosphoshikimate 1-carboxyvinyltransferase